MDWGMFTNYVDMKKGGEVFYVSIINNLAQCALQARSGRATPFEKISKKNLADFGLRGQYGFPKLHIYFRIFAHYFVILAKMK